MTLLRLQKPSRLVLAQARARGEEHQARQQKAATKEADVAKQDTNYHNDTLAYVLSCIGHFWNYALYGLYLQPTESRLARSRRQLSALEYAMCMGSPPFHGRERRHAPMARAAAAPALHSGTSPRYWTSGQKEWSKGVVKRRVLI
jgi:hypothetical protein